MGTKGDVTAWQESYETHAALHTPSSSSGAPTTGSRESVHREVPQPNEFVSLRLLLLLRYARHLLVRLERCSPQFILQVEQLTLQKRSGVRKSITSRRHGDVDGARMGALVGDGLVLHDSNLPS